MKLGDICSTPCFPQAARFDIPPAGCTSASLKFASAQGRSYYAVLLRNHDLIRRPKPDPKIAIVGLSPAATQIGEFVDAYRRSRDYGAAAIWGAFAGLSDEIISMINGLGLARKLALNFPAGTSFANHRDIYVTSLVACASLTDGGSSTDFDPTQFDASVRCMRTRFIEEILDPCFAELNTVLVLGSKGWKALNSVTTSRGETLHDALKRCGKTVLNFPHPSGANREYVKLASLPLNEVPHIEDYVSERWREYLITSLPGGKEHLQEETYKKKRRTVWNSIYKLRWQIANMSGHAA